MTPRERVEIKLCRIQIGSASTHYEEVFQN